MSGAKIGEVIAEARRLVRPTEKQAAAVARAAESALGLVRAEAKNHPEILSVELGGSYAKDTWIKGPGTDIDIYLKFDKWTDRIRFEKIAKSVGLVAFLNCSPRLRFSEHPYVEATCGGILINLVPYYDVSMGQWMSSADRTGFHTEYMKKALTESMRDDVRLLKAALTANGLYGAQIAKNGFSGYVTETLIDRLGGFEETVKKFADIRPGTVIGDAAREFDTTISIIDPVDRNRNLAAAISDENLAKFVLVCRSFLRRPTLDVFDADAAAGSWSKKYWNNMLGVRFGFGERAPDTIWGQAKKSAAALAAQLGKGGFEVIRSRAHVDEAGGKAYLFFLLNAAEIPPTYVQDGPEFFRRRNLDTYIRKNLEDVEMMWVSPRGTVASLKRRKYTRADEYAKSVLRRGILPAGVRGVPRTWIGVGGLNDADRAAAKELFTTDAAILRSG